MALDTNTRALLDRVLKLGGDEKFAAKLAGVQRAKRAVELANAVFVITVLGDLFYFVLTREPLVTLGLVVVAFVALGLAGCAADVASEERAWIPLSQEPALCLSALELVRAHSAAREVRDILVASGRQLYVLDLMVLQRAVEPELKRVALEDETRTANEAVTRQHEICAELHALA